MFNMTPKLSVTVRNKCSNYAKTKKLRFSKIKNQYNARLFVSRQTHISHKKFLSYTITGEYYHLSLMKRLWKRIVRVSLNTENEETIFYYTIMCPLASVLLYAIF